MSTRLTENMIRSNFELYKSDPKIVLVDAFVCSSMCEMWMPFNKTILFKPALENNLERCFETGLDRLNEHLKYLTLFNNPHEIIAASSRYEKEYLHHHTGITDVPLYSYNSFYINSYKYNPTLSEILVMSDNRGSDFVNKIKSFTLMNINKVYGQYQLADLVHHCTIVYLTYSVMPYKLKEIYSLAIPLFLPSMIFYQNVQFHAYNQFSQCKSHKFQHHENTIHPYSPNCSASEDKEAQFYWFQFSDIFQWPHITYFDDFKDLEHKLQQTNFNKINKHMVEEVKSSKRALFETWCKLIQTV